MKKNILFLLAASSILFTSIQSKENQSEKLFKLNGGFSQTELYLKTHSFEKIKLTLGEFNPKVSSLTNKMISMETDTGFFGYHGCTQRYRIFQDILRAVFEETMDYDIPEDFQFLRIPGDNMFALQNDKKSFYNLFDRKSVSATDKNKIIETLFVQPFNEAYGSSIGINNLSNAEKDELWFLSEDFIANLDALAKEDYYDFEFSEDDTPQSLDPFQQEMPNQDRSMESIRKKLQMMMHWVEKQENESDDLLQPLAIPSVAIEKMTKIYVRILKLKNKTVDLNIVKSIVANNYRFVNLLHSTYNLTYSDMNADLLLYFFPYNDTRSDQQSRIICINIPLYGNYHRFDESSVSIFLNDNSIEGGDSHVMGLLADYFEKIGLDRNLPQELRQIAVKELQGNKHGCIMQFFDASENNGQAPLQGVDSAAYVSHTFGIPLKKVEPSQLLVGEVPIRRKTLDLQLRLIPSNHSTLNPYGFLRVVRHDALKPETSKMIISKMRDKLKTGIVDADKLNSYKAEMDTTWNSQ